MDNHQEEGEDSWPDNQWNSNGHNPHCFFWKGSSLLWKDQIHNGYNKEKDPSCNLKIRNRDPHSRAKIDFPAPRNPMLARKPVWID